MHGLDEDSLRDHYELLGLVYGLAARRAVSPRDPPTAEPDSVPRKKRWPRRRHLRCVAPHQRRVPPHAARDGALTAPRQRHAQHVDRRARQLLRARAGKRRHPAWRGARAIVAAIGADDADRAAGACVELLTDQGDLVIKLLASRGMFSCRRLERRRRSSPVLRRSRRRGQEKNLREEGTWLTKVPSTRTVPPSGTGCVECLAAEGWWFHLRALRGLRPHRLL